MTKRCTVTIDSPNPPPKRMRLRTGVARKCDIVDNQSVKYHRTNLSMINDHLHVATDACIGEAAGSPVPGLTAANANGTLRDSRSWNPATMA